MDDNERLIAEFMKQSRQDIADNGFTERVMRGLPESKPQHDWLPTIWNVVMMVIVAILFVALGGVGILKNVLYQYLDNALTQGIDTRWVMVMMIAFVCYVCQKALKTA